MVSFVGPFTLSFCSLPGAGFCQAGLSIFLAAGFMINFFINNPIVVPIVAGPRMAV
jgi:hypothetical protein